jgi:hypothetical protein
MPGTLNDAGVITLPGGQRIVVVVFTKRGTSPDALREDDLAAAARKAITELLDR